LPRPRQLFAFSANRSGRRFRLSRVAALSAARRPRPANRTAGRPFNRDWQGKALVA